MVLRSVHGNALDLKTVKAVGKKYQVDAVFTGALDVTKVKPNVRLSSLLTSMSAEAHVEATLTARLLETRSGATLWTDSANAYETVAHVRIASNSSATFKAQDPEDAYGRLVSNLVYGITRDFRSTYTRR